MSKVSMYWESSAFPFCLAFIGVMLGIYSIEVENEILKVCLYIISIISLFFLIKIIYKIIILKIEIKKNKTKIVVIEIQEVSDITLNGGARQGFEKQYYGIKIRSKKNKYLYFYSQIYSKESNFTVFNKLQKTKKIKIEVYQKSNVIKKILTNL